MKRVWLGMLGVASAATLLLAFQSATKAGDHADAPGAQAVAGADLYDLYTWMGDADTLNLIMTLPAGGFSDQLQYVFHVNSYDSFEDDEGTETRILCTFDSDQIASCWVGDRAYVRGDASDENAPLQSQDGQIKVFTGERNDPFYFNLDGFEDMAESVRALRRSSIPGAWPVDIEDEGEDEDEGEGEGEGEGQSTLACPRLDQGTASNLRNQLALDPESREVTDEFANLNATALVVQVDKSLVNAGGDVLGVWASTNLPAGESPDQPTDQPMGGN